MKTDLASAIGAAIAGILLAYFITNLFIPKIEDVTYKTVEGTITTELTDPNVEVFNYKALNPTVEVYVGDCENYDNDAGVCLDDVSGGDSGQENN
ncbi:hypothetical protein IKG33_02320 [Candidatus Saccharibacteria bacterium]|nr:hypothetical protein [Candidatus Saccharibacteria bacterium]